MPKIDFDNSLTKTSFLRGWQCEKFLWFHRKKTINDHQHYLQGQTFKRVDNPLHKLAYKLFDQGVECSLFQIEEDKDWEASIAKTTELKQAGHRVLYNATVQADRLLCDINLLIQVGDKWDAYVIKSATRISDRSLVGACFQKVTLERAGYPINKFQFITVNNKYDRQGDIDLRQFFKIRDLTRTINLNQEAIIQSIDLQLKALDSPEPPDRKIGIHCTEPSICPYREKCWGDIPQNSVFELVGFPKLGVLDLWSRGIKKIEQILANQNLSHQQEVQRKNQPHVETRQIQKFLDNVTYPLILIDFEGFVPAIPPFEKTKPFDVIPFLFAGLKIEEDGSIPREFHFIAHPHIDPREEFLRNFLNEQHDAKTILVYDPQTEKSILKTLIKTFPKYKPETQLAIDKIIDLSGPIRKKHFYLPKMKGYHSMKYVLPAIVSDMHYDNLEVRSGRMAASVYQMIREEKDLKEIELTMNNLVAYCKRDAIGLVEVFNALKQAVK